MIQSNIGQVIARLKRLDEAIPQAIQKAAEPGYWKPRLESVALKTIRAQWALERSLVLREVYERVTPKVVATIVAEVFEQGTFFAMSIPDDSIQPPMDIAAAAEFNVGQHTPTGRLKKEVMEQRMFRAELMDTQATENLERARQVIRDWVMLEKNRDTRDFHADGTPLSDEEIAERIGAILGIGPTGVIPRERTPTVQDAARKLSGAIERWLNGEGDSPPVNYERDRRSGSAAGLSPEVAAQWLQAVLLAWQKFLLASLPGAISYQLDKLFNSITRELL